MLESSSGREFAITQATNTGKAARAAMSPDGQHVVRLEHLQMAEE